MIEKARLLYLGMPSFFAVRLAYDNRTGYL